MPCCSWTDWSICGEARAICQMRQLEGGYFSGSDHLQIGPRQIWPYLAPERLDGLSTYWILDQEKTACPRPGDQLLREFEPPANG